MLALFALVALGAAAPDDRPTVVVFPFQASAALPRDVDLRIVTVLSNQIAMGGAVRVVPADPDTDRTTFLTAARKLGADYYVTGFLTPLGDGASLIEQLVSTQSGAVVFSNSGQINSLSDVTSQGEVMQHAVIGRFNAGYPSFSTGSGNNATPAPTHPNSTATQPPEANIGSLFHRKKAEPKPTPTPTPKPAPAESPSDAPTP